MQKATRQITYKSIICALSLLSNFSYSMTGGYTSHPLAFGAVVQLIIKSNLTKHRGHCTATKIAPRKYLTAAHCLASDETGEIAQIEKLEITHGSSGENMFHEVPRIVNISVNPRWQELATPGPVTGHKLRSRAGVDHGVIEVETDNDLPIYELDFDVIREGEILITAGYGIQNVFPGLAVPPGELRIASKRAEYTFSQSKVIEFTKEDSDEESYSQSAPGDSGGPLLRVRAGKTMVEKKVTVVGVMSYISGLIFVDPDTGNLKAIAAGRQPVSGYVRLENMSLSGVSGQNNWLRQIAAGNDTQHLSVR